MCYLASAAAILAGGKGTQCCSRWERLGSEFQQGLLSFLVPLLALTSWQNQGLGERREKGSRSVSSLCALETESHGELSCRRHPPLVGTYSGHHGTVIKKHLAPQGAGYMHQRLTERQMTGHLNFPLKICLPEAGPYLLGLLLDVSEMVSRLLLRSVSDMSLTQAMTALKSAWCGSPLLVHNRVSAGPSQAPAGGGPFLGCICSHRRAPAKLCLF